ncbi:hypothetical protein N9242_02065 [Vicingaceae bacterium]|nr:hypothetical protein [Vicingaceae bacterium]
MLTKKLFISIILLLTYSLGFAHNFVPHNHDSETAVHEHSHEENGHSHHHHSTKEQAHQDHEHISHGDHFDEGFYDLLICFLHDADHHEDECDNHYFIPTKTNSSSTNKLHQQKLVATLIALTVVLEKPELTYKLDVNSSIFYRSLSMEDSPLRGPPSIS